MKEEYKEQPCLQQIDFPTKKPVGRPSILPQQPRQSIDLNLLLASRHKLEIFIDGLGELRNTELTEEVASYFQTEKMSKQKMTPNKILRMVDQRIEKMIKNKKIKRNWSCSDIQVLIWVTGKMFEKGLFELRDLKQENFHWHSIADIIPGATSKNCMFKWLSLKKNRITNNNWSKQQETILSTVVKRVGINKWKLASRELYQLTKGSSNKVFRHPKQCREHWRCFLDPALRKGTWDVHEDKLLLEIIVKNNGAKKWSKICRFFNGRTENSVKNRFRILYDRMKSFKNEQLDPDVNEMSAIRNYIEVYLKKVSSTLEDRAQLVRRILAGTENDSLSISEESDNQPAESEAPFIQMPLIKHEQAPKQPLNLNNAQSSDEKKICEALERTATSPLPKIENQSEPEQNGNNSLEIVGSFGTIPYSPPQMMPYYYANQPMGFTDQYACCYAYPYNINYFGFYNQNS